MTDEAEAVAEDDLTPLLVFRAGSQQPKAVLLSLVARLEEIDCRRIEVSDGQYLVQYRDQLMPLVRIDGARLKQDGAVPVLVFSDRGRRMGLIVDEIIDIVEQRLDIEVASERPGLVGYAVVKGSATEIVDIAHFLPQAYADWFRRRDPRPLPATRRIMLVDDSAFFRDMLAPLIKAAGYQVTSMASAARSAWRPSVRRRRSMSWSPTSRCRTWTVLSSPRRLRSDPATVAVPVIALSAMVSADVIERGRRAGFHDFVAKFDRAGLIAAIKGQTEDLNEAA